MSFEQLQNIYIGKVEIKRDKAELVEVYGTVTGKWV